jgi:ATP-dependent Clp protease ATP-binding subunit ClpA
VVQRSEQASRVLNLARAEAERFGHRYLGPEHLVLGILRDGATGASRILEAHGIDLETVRRSTEQAFGGTAVGWAIREATRARRRGVARVPRTPLVDPPMLISQVGYHAGDQARAIGAEFIGPELLLLGVVTDIQTPWPRRMNNRWRRQLHAFVGLPNDYRGAAGPLLAAFGVDLEALRSALVAELQAGVR